MKRKTQNVPTYSYSIYPYIILLIIFVCIVYLITLRKRVEEFFTQKNDKIYVKKDSNAFEVEKVWEGKINDGYLSFWQRKNKRTQDLYSLGQFAIIKKEKLEALPDTVINDIPILNLLVKGGKFPLSYIKIWSSDMLNNKDIQDFSIWQPVPPEGYVAMGDIISPSLSKPSLDEIVCVPINDTEPNEQIKTQIFETDSMSIWNIGNYMSFMASPSKDKPNVRVKDIVEIKQNVLNRHEPDPNEKYVSLKITMNT